MSGKSCKELAAICPFFCTLSEAHQLAKFLMAGDLHADKLDSYWIIGHFTVVVAYEWQRGCR